MPLGSQQPEKEVLIGDAVLLGQQELVVEDLGDAAETQVL
jgi:hypothetical protein